MVGSPVISASYGIAITSVFNATRHAPSGAVIYS
jgi:hypothetical protein